MRPDKWQQKQVRTEGATSVSLKELHRDPRYIVQELKVVRTGDTGLLRLFRLVPNDPKLMGFAARWDDAPQDVDIDPEGATESERKAFLIGETGYRGHHSRRTSEAPREYEINISIPGIHVYTALLSLNLDVGVRIGDAVAFDDSVAVKVGMAAQAEIVRPSKN